MDVQLKGKLNGVKDTVVVSWGQQSVPQADDPQMALPFKKLRIDVSLGSHHQML